MNQDLNLQWRNNVVLLRLFPERYRDNQKPFEPFGSCLSVCGNGNKSAFFHRLKLLWYRNSGERRGVIYVGAWDFAYNRGHVF